MTITKSYIDQISYAVIGAAIEVHKSLGPGLLESVYHRCLKHELSIRKISFESELRVPIIYKELDLEAEIRCDFLIENLLVVEIKAVDYVLPVHEAQILTYMNLLQVPKRTLLNFNVVNLFNQGQKTFVNGQYRTYNEG